MDGDLIRTLIAVFVMGLATIGWMWRMTNSLGKRLDARIDASTERLNTRIDAATESLGKRLDARMDASTERLDARMNVLHVDVMGIKERLAALEGQFEMLLRGLHIEIGGKGNA